MHPRPDAPMDDVKTFRGLSGVKTADRPMMGHSSRGQALIRSRVFRRSVSPDHEPANRDEVSRIDDRRSASQVHGPGI